MIDITCICEGVYSQALTRGKRYKVLEMSEDKYQVRLFRDNNLKRWYPSTHFDFENRPVPILQLFSVDDSESIDNLKHGATEVTIKLSTGELRWCLFFTPSALAECGNWVPGTQVRFHYNMPHLIIINEITHELIEKTLCYIDSQNELIACTLPLN